MYEESRNIVTVFYLDYYTALHCTYEEYLSKMSEGQSPTLVLKKYNDNDNDNYNRCAENNERKKSNCEQDFRQKEPTPTYN